MNIANFIKKHGVLITENVLEEIKNLSSEEIKKLEKKILEEKPVFIDENFILSIKSPKIDIIELKLKEKTINFEEFVDLIQNYFDTFSDIIKKKINPFKLVSISSIKENDEYCVIGMVKNIKEMEDKVIIELEDKTGVIKCFVDKNFFKNEENILYYDEVIGVEGEYKNNVLYVKKIIFPDIEEIKPYLFEKETVLYARNDKESIRISLNGKFYTIIDPTVLIVDNLNILVFINEKNINPKLFLRKRNVFPGKISLSGIIQIPPHLVITTHIPSYRENYKGVKILGLEPKEEVRIKLKNMEEMV